MADHLVLVDLISVNIRVIIFCVTDAAPTNVVVRVRRRVVPVRVPRPSVRAIIPVPAQDCSNPTYSLLELRLCSIQVPRILPTSANIISATWC